MAICRGSCKSKPHKTQAGANSLKANELASFSILIVGCNKSCPKKICPSSWANEHNPNSPTAYAYLTSPITIDDKNYVVDMDIRKSERGNRFYIHKIKMTDEVAKLGLKNRNKLNTSSASNNISQNDDIVNSNIRKKSDNDTRKFSIDPEFKA